ncbi:MAG TPA: 2-amino-4-hydroxy-6-hydroxymethyldihydropteridine diphosphokinase [Chloroflexota bacterium]|nr:2-amino-4-hydroxy-6-hydroxymethyldihydropteridine diphosphokinase [Chloroflexota bacterium]
MATAYIALGSNLGDREATLREALRRLGALGAVEAVSPFFDTDPAGIVDQPRFLNAAARLRTDLTPGALLQGLLDIETAMGRVRLVRWGPRTIDLDLLLFDDLVSEQPGITLPHPRMHERRFVLEPLATIAAEVRHPVLGRTVGELLAGLDAAQP